MKAKDVIDRSNGGIVGIDEGLNVYGGYDNSFDPAGATAVRPEWIDTDEWNAMPKEEKLILADRMIERWQRYKESAV